LLKIFYLIKDQFHLPLFKLALLRLQLAHLLEVLKLESKFLLLKKRKVFMNLAFLILL